MGNPEFCFGAVGKGCGGFGDLKEGDTGATHPLWLTAGCSKEVSGKRKCWVVPGSIKHDNCCVKYPSGKQCGGPGKNPLNKNEPDKDWFTGKVNPAGELNHDGNCVKEWDDAFWDVQNGRAWEADFSANVPANLTPATSPGGRYGGGEVVDSVSLCAQDGRAISARHKIAFCCSGKGQRFKLAPPLVEDWIICGDPITMPSLISSGKLPPPKIDLTRPPPGIGIGTGRSAGGRRSTQSKVDASYPLLIEKPSDVTVTSSGKDFTCKDTKCISYHKVGETIVLTAQPANSKLNVVEWSKDGCASVKGTECKVVMNDQGKIAKVSQSKIIIVREEPPQPAPPKEAPAPSSTGQPCNPSIPKYQQPGCVEQAEQQKRSPYDGKPCPGDNIPNYAKIGCIP